MLEIKICIYIENIGVQHSLEKIKPQLCFFLKNLFYFHNSNPEPSKRIKYHREMGSLLTECIIFLLLSLQECKLLLMLSPQLSYILKNMKQKNNLPCFTRLAEARIKGIQHIFSTEK